MTEVEFLDELSANLRDALSDSGLSASEVAAEIDVDKSTVSRYLNGVSMPTVKNLVNIVHVLGCDINEIIMVDELIE